MKIQGCCYSVVFALAFLEFSGCSAIGYAIGRGIDPSDTTRSILQNDLRTYVGEKVTILTNEEKLYNGELLGVSVLPAESDAGALRNIYLFKSLTYSKGYREEKDIHFSEDQLQDILVTEKRGSNRYILGGIGLGIDVATVIVAIKFSNTWSGWGKGMR